MSKDLKELAPAMRIALDRAGGGRRTPISRATDRRITFAGLLAALAFATSGLASLALPPAIRLGTWLPMHLTLAGAATAAIVAVLPFFTTALAGTAPANPWIRSLAIALVAGGTVAVLTAHGHPGDLQSLALPAGSAYVAGLGLGAVAALGPLRSPLARRWRLLELAYAIALVDVALGAGLATLLVAGQPDVAAGWVQLRPAHAWLNLFGFVSLTIVATVAHLGPTIAGSRIRRRPSIVIAIVALALGAPSIALAYAAGWDALARAGGTAVVVGGLAFAVHGWEIHRDRGRWTSELEWHRLTGSSLLLGSGWFAIAAGIAGGRTVALGVDPAAWIIGPLLAPLVIGFVAQTLIGAGSHLLPSIGPGDSERHAYQRRVLARASVPRLFALNAGCALSLLGAVAGTPAIGTLGGALIVGAVASAIVLFGWAALPDRSISGGSPTR